jgi:hypothetical protein
MQFESLDFGTAKTDAQKRMLKVVNFETFQEFLRLTSEQHGKLNQWIRI